MRLIGKQLLAYLQLKCQLENPDCGVVFTVSMPKNMVPKKKPEPY
jgi:hypothetical protein